MKKFFVVLFCTCLILSGCSKEDTNTVEGNVSDDKLSANTEFDMSIEEQYDDVLTRYFSYDSIFVNEYDNITRYPVAYQDVMIDFYAYVRKVLEEKDGSYKILVELFEGYNFDYVPHYIVIEGTYVNGKRYLENDELKIYGIYKGMENYTVDGSNEVLPKVVVDKTVIVDVTGTVVEYDEDDLRKVAEAFFDTTFTLVKPYYDSTTEAGRYLMSLPFHYIVTLDNQSNARFNKYRLYTGSGFIDVATEDESGKVKRYISKSTDGESFILTTYTEDSKYLELQLYDKDFKEIWTRKFEDVSNYIWDNNNGRIAINVNNDLYYIDEVTGKDIVSPFMVGAGLSFELLSNGDVIFVSQNKSDFVMYIDSTGSIKWKDNSEFNPDWLNAIMVANDKIYVNYAMVDTGNDLFVNVYSQEGELLVSTFSS